VYHQPSPAARRRLAAEIIATLRSCPIPVVARLGRTFTTWWRKFLAYADTDGASNGEPEAVNGLIELHVRIARGCRNQDNYRLRMLLIGGGLADPHLR
jgi:transposase